VNRPNGSTTASVLIQCRFLPRSVRNTAGCLSECGAAGGARRVGVDSRLPGVVGVILRVNLTERAVESAHGWVQRVALLEESSQTASPRGIWPLDVVKDKVDAEYDELEVDRE
jgi:hypothetical protein